MNRPWLVVSGAGGSGCGMQGRGRRTERVLPSGSGINFHSAAASGESSSSSSGVRRNTRPLASPTTSLEASGENAPYDTAEWHCKRFRTKGFCWDRMFQILTTPSEEPEKKQTGLEPQAMNLTPVSSLEMT